MNAFILAAGLGTRLKPLTDSMPKALVPVDGKPLLRHLIDKLVDAGFDNIVVNVHHFAGQIIDYLNQTSFDANIIISDESSRLLDTGGAIKKAATLFPNREPFLVHNVDILHKMDLRRLFIDFRDGAEASLLVSNRATSRYLLFDRKNRLVGWTNITTKEVKSPFNKVKTNPEIYNPLAFSGIHIFSPSLLRLMGSFPDRFSIIDFYLTACEQHHIKGVDITGNPILDVGKINSLHEAEQFLIA